MPGFLFSASASLLLIHIADQSTLRFSGETCPLPDAAGPQLD
jgi:hypothetical protein